MSKEEFEKEYTKYHINDNLYDFTGMDDKEFLCVLDLIESLGLNIIASRSISNDAAKLIDDTMEKKLVRMVAELSPLNVTEEEVEKEFNNYINNKFNI